MLSAWVGESTLCESIRGRVWVHRTVGSGCPSFEQLPDKASAMQEYRGGLRKQSSWMRLRPPNDISSAKSVAAKGVAGKPFRRCVFFERCDFASD